MKQIKPIKRRPKGTGRDRVDNLGGSSSYEIRQIAIRDMVNEYKESKTIYSGYLTMSPRKFIKIYATFNNVILTNKL